jgi:uncharacterized C2H2 Zn-finger protein
VGAVPVGAECFIKAKMKTPHLEQLLSWIPTEDLYSELGRRRLAMRKIRQIDRAIWKTCLCGHRLLSRQWQYRCPMCGIGFKDRQHYLTQIAKHEQKK